jgi:hypothetical protein
MKTFDFIIYGNNTGALAAAIELGKKHKVALVNPTPMWGAHFAGIMINGENFDIGMNFFEFTTFHKPSNDLMTYNASVRNDSARFFKIVERYVSSRIDVVEVKDIDVYSSGTYGKDIVMANALGILNELPEGIKVKIRNELEAILKKGDLTYHASQKKLDEKKFMQASYYEVSMANHGPTFHELFVEPYCKKIFNMSSKECPALLHRIAWAPLFYPETLMKGIQGKNDLAPTLFHYPVKGYFAAIIDEMMKELRNNPNVELLNVKPLGLERENGYTITLEQDSLYAKNMVWCNDLYSLMALVQNKEMMQLEAQKASVTVAFCKVDSAIVKKKFSCLYFSDMNTPLYRVTNQEHAAGLTSSEQTKLIFEMNFDFLNELGITSEPLVKAHLNEVLMEAGILEQAIAEEFFVVKSLKNAVNLPTLHNFNNFEKLSKTALSLYPDLEMVGPASGMVSTSFNDQIVQALKLGAKYN